MSAGLKAGLVGAAVAVLLSLLLPAPRVIWIAVAPSVVLYAVVGILAAYWARSPRAAGKGASAGAVAGLVTGLAHGLIPIIIDVARFIAGGPEAPLARQFHQLIRGRDWIGIGGVALWCGSAITVAVALGAAAGAIFSSLQRERPAPSADPEAGE